MKSFYMAIIMVMLLICVLCAFSLADDEKQGYVIEKEYIIGMGDVIQIYIWQYNQFNGTMTVGPDGKITIPILGDIPAAGLTRKQIKDELTTRLSKYVTAELEDSDVTVSIVQFNSQKIFVFGSVVNPKTLTFFSAPSLLEVMIQVTPSPDADLAQVKVIPSDPLIRGTIVVNMVDVLKNGDTSQLPKLLPGDTIYVPTLKKPDVEIPSQPIPSDTTSPTQPVSDSKTPKSEFIINVMGAVTTGSLVFTTEPNLTQVLVRAGGVNNYTTLKNIRVIRGEKTDDQNVINVDFEKYLRDGDDSLLPRLYSGDTIYVPPLTPEKMAKVAIMITGAVIKPGSYEISEPLDLLDAISMAGGLSPNANPEEIRLRKETEDSYQEKIVNIRESLTDVRSDAAPEMVGPGFRIYVPVQETSPAVTTATAARGLAGFLVNIFQIYSFYRFVR